jgi:hypothetical protein
MLWRKEVDNRPGMLASTLQPLAEAGANLQVVMAYRYPGGEDKAAIEVHPLSGRKPNAAARKAGLTPSPIPVLLVEGDNKPGLGHTIAKALGEAGKQHELRDGTGGRSKIRGGVRLREPSRCEQSRNTDQETGRRRQEMICFS